MTLKWRVAKFETDRENNISEKHLGSINKTCTMVDAFYAMDQKTEEKKWLNRNEKRKKNRNQEGPNMKIPKPKKQMKKWRHPGSAI